MNKGSNCSLNFVWESVIIISGTVSDNLAEPSDTVNYENIAYVLQYMTGNKNIAF